MCKRKAGSGRVIERIKENRPLHTLYITSQPVNAVQAFAFKYFKII